jgi:ABC-2 type transport system permease protein
MMRLVFWVRIYLRLQVAHLLARLEYEADFWLGLVGAFLTQFAGVAFAWVLFQQVPTLHGWTLEEVACLYALVLIPRGLVELFCDGSWQLRQLVNSGQFDRLLVRPLPPVLQLMAQASSIHGLGSVLLGAFILFEALSRLGLSLDAARLMLLMGTIAGAATMIAALNLLTNSVAFWELHLSGSFPALALNLAELAKYPMTLYGRFLRLFLTAALPLAFISYYPALILLRKEAPDAWLGWCSPVAGPLFAGVAALFWRAGLRRYQGAGH